MSGGGGGLRRKLQWDQKPRMNVLLKAISTCSYHLHYFSNYNSSCNMQLLLLWLSTWYSACQKLHSLLGRKERKTNYCAFWIANTVTKQQNLDSILHCQKSVTIFYILKDSVPGTVSLFALTYFYCCKHVFISPPSSPVSCPKIQVLNHLHLRWAAVWDLHSTKLSLCYWKQNRNKDTHQHIWWNILKVKNMNTMSAWLQREHFLFSEFKLMGNYLFQF
jgi:hypothetical protein